MIPPSSQALSLFSCYAHEDATLCEQFEKHLAMLKRLGWIQSWSDRDIHAGAEWQHAIDHYLRTADLLLLFISADFLHSEYCYSIEMQEALRRHQAGEAVVIPILLRPVEWEKTPLGTLQVLPRDGRPVTSWSNPDEAYQQIAKEIRLLIEALRRQVVIISSPQHQTFIQRLVDHLTAHSIPSWETVTPQNLTLLKEQIREAFAVVVIASSGTERIRTLQYAQQLSDMYRRPIVGIWIGDEAQGNKELVSQPSPRYEQILVYSGQEEHALQHIRTSLYRKRSSSAFPPINSSQEHPKPGQEPRNPYKGLRAFTADDTRDFFGRTPLIESLVASLEAILSHEKKGQQPGRLLAVVGASGSGKSSVVNAGLLPALQSGQIIESETWVYLDPIVPGTHPLDALAFTFLGQFPEKSLKMLREDLGNTSSQGLHFYAATLAKRHGCRHVVLVVDQFEEIFTLTANEEERQQFLDLLVTACTKRGAPLIVVLTLRADFYDRPMQYPALYKLIANHQIPMLPMTLTELRAVITQPARLHDVQLGFEGNLVGDMLFDIQGQIGALPLLQFTLEQLFARREGHVLTEHAYQQIGGIRGALAKHAQETYLALPSQEHRKLARMLFLRLLDPGMTEQETTRRRAVLTEFVFADPSQNRLMQETLDTFVQARLLTINANERAGTTIEVSHEALIREWPLLLGWLREAREDIQLQQSISKDAAMWEQNKRAGDRLYQGTRLKEARAWAKRNSVSKQEEAFLRASAARRLRSLLTVITVLFLMVASSGIAGWVVFFQPNPNYVTNANDDGTGSLRWAIKNASSNSIIMFAPTLKEHPIILQSANIHVTQQHLTIESTATSHITVRVMGVSFVVDKPASVIITNISFQGSKSEDQSSLIENEGKLTLNTCSISDNTSYNDGGGIYNIGTLTLTNSTISRNIASNVGGIIGIGGGIYNIGTLTLTNSTISRNTASDYGGGIHNIGTVTLTNSTISGNTAQNGGGISNNSGYDQGPKRGTVTLTNSTISGNTASYYGGGIYNNGNTFTLTNSTIARNIASYGGGILNSDSYIVLTNSTISDNTATYDGGGILNHSGAASTYATLIFCSIVNNKAGQNGSDIFNFQEDSQVFIKASIVGSNIAQSRRIGGEITSNGFNVIQQLSLVKFAVNIRQSTDRSVDDLKKVFGSSPVLHNNGGPTETYQLAPNADNPAIGIIPRNACTDADNNPILTDQRGMPRPGKKKQFCDSGAYEYQGSP